MLRTLFLYSCLIAGKCVLIIFLMLPFTNCFSDSMSIPIRWQVLLWNLNIHKPTTVKPLFIKNNFRKVSDICSFCHLGLMGNLKRWTALLNILNWASMWPPEGHITIFMFLDISGAGELVKHSLFEILFSCIFYYTTSSWFFVCLFSFTSLPIHSHCFMWGTILHLILKYWGIWCPWPWKFPESSREGKACSLHIYSSPFSWVRDPLSQINGHLYFDLSVINNLIYLKLNSYSFFFL